MGRRSRLGPFARKAFVRPKKATKFETPNYETIVIAFARDERFKRASVIARRDKRPATNKKKSERKRNEKKRKKKKRKKKKEK